MADESTRDRCAAYNVFKKQFLEMREKHKALNEVIWQADTIHGKACTDEERREVQTVFYRSAIVSVLATWEAYVQDLFVEVRDIVVASIKRDDPSKLSDKGYEMVKKAIEHKQRSNPEMPLVDLCMKLIRNPEHWKELLDIYMQYKLDAALRVTPVFHGSSGIDKKFQDLFTTDHTLSCTIMERNLSHSFRDKTNVEVILTSPEALNDLIQLYYGARCVFAHGQPDRTLGPGGVLHKFPEETELTKKVGVKSVACRLSTLYQNLQNYGRYAWVYYPTLINIQRFIIYLACRLFQAVSQCIYKEFGLEIWGFASRSVSDSEQDEEESELHSLFEVESDDDS